VKTCAKRLRLEVVGWVTMREERRCPGRVFSVVVSRRPDAQCANCSVEIEHEVPIRTDTLAGVDLGVTEHATFSDDTGRVISAKPLRSYLKTLNLSQRWRFRLLHLIGCT